jgi:hypothetical protein
MSTQQDFTDLPNLSLYRYENFLNIYTDLDQTKFYNLLRSINILPANNSSVEDSYVLKSGDTWLSISYNYYKTIDLWWLVCDYNQIINPTKMPPTGTNIKLLKSSYVWTIIQNLQQQINN